MLEVIYTVILCAVFFLASGRERRFRKNRDKYIDESRVYISDKTSSEQGL